jgi:hypothetical protein
MKEFIKLGKNYMIKGSNGYVISAEQKAQYEKNLLDPKHEPCNCGKKKNKKALHKVEVQNDTIEETTTTEK